MAVVFQVGRTQNVDYPLATYSPWVPLALVGHESTASPLLSARDALLVIWGTRQLTVSCSLFGVSSVVLDSGADDPRALAWHTGTHEYSTSNVAGSFRIGWNPSPEADFVAGAGPIEQLSAGWMIPIYLDGEVYPEESIDPVVWITGDASSPPVGYEVCGSVEFSGIIAAWPSVAVLRQSREGSVVPEIIITVALEEWDWASYT